MCVFQDLTLSQLRHAIYKEIDNDTEPRTPALSFNAELTPVPKSPSMPLTKAEEQMAKDTEQLVASIPPQLVVGEIELTPPSENLSTNAAPVDSKPADDNVFKRPFTSKLEPDVKVKTEDLKAELTDVEMLSARSTDERQPMSATFTDKKDILDAAKDDKNKTISEDTKNLIKAALLNASFKKRTGI